MLFRRKSTNHSVKDEGVHDKVVKTKKAGIFPPFYFITS